MERLEFIAGTTIRAGQYKLTLIGSDPLGKKLDDFRGILNPAGDLLIETKPELYNRLWENSGKTKLDKHVISQVIEQKFGEWPDLREQVTIVALARMGLTLGDINNGLKSFGKPPLTEQEIEAAKTIAGDLKKDERFKNLDFKKTLSTEPSTGKQWPSLRFPERRILRHGALNMPGFDSMKNLGEAPLALNIAPTNSFGNNGTKQIEGLT